MWRAWRTELKLDAKSLGLLRLRKYATFQSKSAENTPQLIDLRPIPHRVLDSTSPACTRITREEKLARWRDALASFIDG
jgi:G:T/U-mismatch repair DNA glycosylase